VVATISLFESRLIGVWEGEELHFVLDHEYEKRQQKTMCGKPLPGGYPARETVIDVLEPALCISCASRAALFIQDERS